MKESTYVHYGCGFNAPEEWRNFDASPTLRFERMPLIGKLYTRNDSRFPANVEYGDIIKGLPVKNSSCRAVFCSHVFEHLAFNEFNIALHNTYKILSQNGVFRFVVPDLEFYINEYLNNNADDSAIDFMKNTGLGHEKRSRGIKAFILDWIGNSQHLWMWDFNSLKHVLSGVGFSSIRKAEFGDATDPMFQEVENVQRWEKSLGVHCVKC